MSSSVEEIKRLLVIAESGDSKKAAFKAVAEKITAELQLRNVSKRALAKEIGKDESFIRAIVSWQKSGYEADTPWLTDTKATTRAARSHAKKVLRDPVERKQVFESLSDEERAEIIEAATTEGSMKKAMEKPKVKKSVDAEEKRAYMDRQKKNKFAAQQRLRGTPLSQFFMRMSTKLGDWAQDLRSIRSVGFDTLAPQHRPHIIEMHQKLIDEAQTNIDSINGVSQKDKDDADVIEGRVVNIRELTA